MVACFICNFSHNEYMYETYLSQQLIVKKSPVVMVKTFIVLQMTAVAVFFLAAVLADYGEIYDNLPLANSLSFYIAEAVGIFLFETILVFYIFFSWYKEYYEITEDKVVHGKGIVFRKQNVISLRTLKSVSYRQGPLGRLTKYGAVDLAHDNTTQITTFDHIPEPRKYADLLVNIKDSVGNIRVNPEPESLASLISKGEHERLEFKTSFRWDVLQNKVNKNLEKAVMKTIVSFLNSGGGYLLVGVDDEGKVMGLENDYRSLPKPNADGFQNHFTNVFHSMIGPQFRQFVDLSVHKINGQECCLVRVMPSGKPAYLKLDNGEEFYIRTGNGTTGLKLSETSSYIDSHFRAKLL